MSSSAPRTALTPFALTLGLAVLSGCQSTARSRPASTPTPEATTISGRGMTLERLRTLGADVEPIVVRAADAYGLGVYRPDRAAWLAMEDRAGQAQAILGELTPEQWTEVRWLSERRLGRSFLVVGAGLRPAWMIDDSPADSHSGG